VACADNGNGVEDFVWTTWTPSSASGTGKVWQKICTPDCANGTIGIYPVDVSLSDVEDTSMGPLFSQMTFVYQGTGPNGHTTDHFALPLRTSDSPADSLSKLKAIARSSDCPNRRERGRSFSGACRFQIPLPGQPPLNRM
jgi:hypothetical protein